MNKELAALGRVVAILTAILSYLSLISLGLQRFMEWSGASAYLAETYGAPFKILIWAVVFALGLAAGIRFLNCFMIVGAGAEAPDGYYCEEFDRQRESLADYQNADDEYSKRLKRFLARVDRFFDDAGAPGQRAFLLQNSAPLWTAPSYDRCLLLALIYPVLSILSIWFISGEVGPAEKALLLQENVDLPQRALSLAGTLFLPFAFWRSIVSEGWRKGAWISVTVAVAFAFAGTAAAGAAAAFAGAVAVAVAVAALSQSLSLPGTASWAFFSCYFFPP